MKQLHFDVAISAPKQKVWRIMLDLDTYQEWTRPFMEGSTFKGSWDKGEKIRFVSPGGDGMLSEVVDNKTHDRISLRVLGMVKNGKEDQESPGAKAWKGAREIYTLTEADGSTKLSVDVDTVEEMEADFGQMWPAALSRLRELCET
jgi:uncharacterized protein YndB with AHSA1/START domain